MGKYLNFKHHAKDHFVPVDTDSVIHKLRVELAYQLLMEGGTHELERAKRFELSTFSLATRCSTTELRPHNINITCARDNTLCF